MPLQIARSAAELDRLRPLWEHLLTNSASAGIFQSFAWNRLAAACFSDREEPYVVAVETGSGAAIIPAARTRDGLVFLGEALFDYRDFLSAGDPAALQAAWAALAELRVPLAVTALRGGEARSRWADFAPADFSTAPRVLCAETTPEAFAAQHSRLSRSLRRIARAHATLRCHDGNASALIAWIYNRKAAQLAGTPQNLFADPARVSFMVAACALAPGACDVFTFEHQDLPIAALVTFRDGCESATATGARGMRRFYTVFFDSAWAQFSPGTALVFEITRQSLAAGFDCDYMTGEQPHKTRFMTSAVQLYRIEASPALLAHVAGVEVPTVAA